MQIYKFSLNEHFPNLGRESDSIYVECYINAPYELYGSKIGNYPCLIICPGGGYSHVSPREATPIAMNFISEGYHVFIIRYSTNPHGFPQQLREVAAALEIVRNHADEWQCDMNNITIMGFSAGGHLAAQYSNRYDCPEIRELFPNSIPVQRTVLCYPVITSDETYRHAGTIKTFVGHEPEDGYEKGCSCELIVTEKTPPTFIWHTSEDTVVPVENSLLYASALRRHKVPFELHIYPYGSHGLATVDTLTNAEIDDRTAHCHEWIDACKKWLRLR